MRKVFLKVLFVLTLGVFSFGSFGSNAYCEEKVVSLQESSGEEYTYVKVELNGVSFIFVFDSEGRLADVYPDGCGGPGHGGH